MRLIKTKYFQYTSWSFYIPICFHNSNNLEFLDKHLFSKLLKLEYLTCWYLSQRPSVFFEILCKTLLLLFALLVDLISSLFTISNYNLLKKCMKQKLTMLKKNTSLTPRNVRTFAQATVFISLGIVNTYLC